MRQLAGFLTSLNPSLAAGSRTRLELLSHARGHHPLLAPQHARRREGGGGAARATAGGGCFYTFLRSGAGERGDSRAAGDGIISESAAEELPVAIAGDADGAREFRSARVRSDRVERIGAGEGRACAVERATRLLLPHADAVFVGPVSGVSQRVYGERVEAGADGAGGELSAAVGLQYGSARG